MKTVLRFLLLSLCVLVLIRCDAVKHTPIVTFKDQTEKLHDNIEKISQKQYANQNYQSLAYGDLKVYKPESFVQLDSMYRIKKEYLDNNDLRGLKQSGIEELIPGYRVAAQENIDEVQYEIEHIFQISSGDDSLKIHHSFFLFNYKDSLISVTPFYNFKIAEKHKDLYYAYQFNYHFVTDRDLYISQFEMDFLHFFKQREFQLIGEKELQPFMNHTMNLMEMAKRQQSIDYRQLTRGLAIEELKKLKQEIVIEDFGTLFALEENGFVQAYELKIEWSEEDGKHKVSTYTYSPYLEIQNVEIKLK